MKRISVAVLALGLIIASHAVQTAALAQEKRPVITGTWKGYFTQPGGFAGSQFFIQIDLESEKGTDAGLKGRVRLERATVPEHYHVMSLKVAQEGNQLRLADLNVIETTRALGTGWLVRKTFDLTLGANGSLTGTWSDPTEIIAGKGQVHLVRLDYRVLIERKEITPSGLIVGGLSVNGVALGQVYENAKKAIPAGSYPGVRRFVSEKRFVQGPGGQMDKRGDFLIEIAKVPDRSDILIHPGNKIEHSQGCVLAGPVELKGQLAFAPKLLKEMRLLFYGMEPPNPMDPVFIEKETKIVVEIRESLPVVVNKSLQEKKGDKLGLPFGVNDKKENLELKKAINEKEKKGP